MKAPADNAVSMEPAVQADMHSAAQTSTLPCTLACTLPSVQPAMHPDMEPVAHPVIGNNFCRKGLSFAQIQILSVLLGIGTNVTKYRELACALERFFGIRRSPDAVRGIVERLAGRGILFRGDYHLTRSTLSWLITQIPRAKNALCTPCRKTA